MYSTWYELPEDRPTFEQLMHTLASLHGASGSLTNKYHTVEGPSAPDPGIDIYSTIDSQNPPSVASSIEPLFLSMTTLQDRVQSPAVSEYEVPVSLAGTSTSNSLSLPVEYEQPVSRTSTASHRMDRKHAVSNEYELTSSIPTHTPREYELPVSKATSHTTVTGSLV